MSDKKLIYCGLKTYTDLNTGEEFTKTASGQYDKIDDEEKRAEERFLKKKFKDKSIECE